MWYPGDMELYYAMQQNFSRVERGYGWPAYWRSEGFRNRVTFRRTYELAEETSFTAYSRAVGYVEAAGRKVPFGQIMTCSPGTVRVSIHCGRIDAFPSVYVEGSVIFSGDGWEVEDYSAPPVPVGTSRNFTRRDQDPEVWEFTERRFDPIAEEETAGGLLFTFATELTAVPVVTFKARPDRALLCLGESREEALSVEHCYLRYEPDEAGRCPRSAFRYVFLPGVHRGEAELYALYQYVDIPSRASFRCDDEELNAIWSVAEHTFQLCSGIFFLDGVKRDKWIWSGDAYQSLFVNRWLTADPDIERRTLTALRGNDPMTRHINTILDYSLLWLLGVKAHVDGYGDVEFLRRMFPKMQSLMRFTGEQLDENGFVVGRENDWVFIDWADFDKDGPFCPEQLLLAACYGAMASSAEMLGEDGGPWREKKAALLRAVDRYFWDEERGAYIDSFASGKRHVTRHAAIFAIVFDLTDEERKHRMLETVLHNEAVPAITTPYFKFFELEALCRLGCLREVLEELRSYWGGMLKRGAVTFWEEYDPSAPPETMYDMYGDKFGKSLCHAWGASPIYLLEKYFLGVRQESGTLEVRPALEFFRTLDCTVPVSDGTVRITWDGETLNVSTAPAS